MEVAWRERGDAPLLYLHGVPNSSVMWEPFLERTGGIALDLPGFGDSAKPADFPYSVAGYGRVLERFAHQRGLDRVTLVMHDWGAVGLALAQSRPELVERVVIIAGVPLLPGYHWHKYARAWRRPFVGEMAMGLTFRWNLRRVMPDAAGRRRLAPLRPRHPARDPQAVPLGAGAERWRRPVTGLGAGHRPGARGLGRGGPLHSRRVRRPLRRGARRAHDGRADRGRRPLGVGRAPRPWSTGWLPSRASLTRVRLAFSVSAPQRERGSPIRDG